MRVLILLCLILNSYNLLAQINNEANNELLRKFHKVGITKCDNLIMNYNSIDNTKHPNWAYEFTYHKEYKTSPIKQATLIFLYGYKNDSLKTSYHYTQKDKKCTITKESTLTFIGSCSDNINLDYWYVASDMINLDYTKYKNPYGNIMFAKEIKIGNFRGCIQEYFSIIE